MLDTPLLPVVRFSHDRRALSIDTWESEGFETMSSSSDFSSLAQCADLESTTHHPRIDLHSSYSLRRPPSPCPTCMGKSARRFGIKVSDGQRKARDPAMHVIEILKRGQKGHAYQGLAWSSSSKRFQNYYLPSCS